MSSKSPRSRPVNKIRETPGSTGRKEVEEELRQSKAHLQALLRSTADGILSVGVDNRVLLSNDLFAQMLQIPGEVISTGNEIEIHQFIHDRLQDPQGYLERVEELSLSEEESYDILNFKGGRTIERLSRPLMQDGKLLGRVWTFRDLTGQQHVERALALSEERFRMIIELSFDAVSLLDENLQVIYSSPGVERLLGFAPGERVGHDGYELIHPDDLPAISEIMEKALKEPTQNVGGQIRFRHKDGTWRWFEGIVTNLLDVPAVRAIVSRSHDITEHKRLQELLQEQATTDELTGCANRRQFMELARAEIVRCTRFGHSLTLALVDLDHFKQINDTHGHVAGDRVLAAFASICKANIREIDLLARIGGDEFAMLLPEVHPHQAREILERLARVLTATPVDPGGSPVTIAVSCGVCGITEGPQSLDTLLVNADMALYEAKTRGRNRIVLFGSDH